MGVQAEEGLDKHLFKRLPRASGVRRFIFTWMSLMILLIGVMIAQIQHLPALYKTTVPARGGIYAEGILGTLTNANPLFAVTSVDRSASRLIFAGLLTYDQKGKLVGDLAEKWEVDQRGTSYTVTLRDDLVWHDGKPVTAADVVFTYTVIQNKDAKSPLERSWRGIKVVSKDSKTVVFTLPNILSSFPHSMTNGIVPKHWLDGVPMAQLRSVSFNTASLIGSGPFMFDGINVTGNTPETREQQIGMVPFERYHNGQPKLNRFIIRSFRNQNSMVNSFKAGEINAMAGLAEVPEAIKSQSNTSNMSIPLDSQVNVFFKTTHTLLGDVRLRQALTRGTNPGAIISGLSYPAIVSDAPLLKYHIGYNPGESQIGFNPKKAKESLDKAGWKPGPDGIRAKKKQRLSFALFTQDTSEYAAAARELERQWRELGVELQLFIQPEEELQVAIDRHTYDVLLYGISLGSDPDVFPFWHSSQASESSDIWLNFSEYSSAAADAALEAGRTRFDPKIRARKYHDFLRVWKQDAPAVALYQPRYLYITRGDVFHFNPLHMTTGTDRFVNVENWMIREELVVPE